MKRILYSFYFITLGFLFSGCQGSESIAPMNSKAKGTSPIYKIQNIGSQKTCDEKDLAKYKEQIDLLEPYSDILLPKFQSMHESINGGFNKKEFDALFNNGFNKGFNHFLVPSLETIAIKVDLYIINCHLDINSLKKNRSFVEVSEQAVQTDREIFIQASDFYTKSTVDQAKLMLNELVKSYYLLKFQTLDEICYKRDICIKENILDTAVNNSIELRPQKFKSLDDGDNKNIANIFQFIWNQDAYENAYFERYLEGIATDTNLNKFNAVAFEKILVENKFDDRFFNISNHYFSRYRVKLNYFPEYLKYTRPILEKISDKNNNNFFNIYYGVLNRWYLFDKNLKDLPRYPDSPLFYYSEKSAHTFWDVIIFESEYNQMSVDEKSKFFLNELLISLYLIKFQSKEQICEAYLAALKKECPLQDKKIEFEDPRQLTIEEINTLNEITDWIWAQRNIITQMEFEKKLIENKFPAWIFNQDKLPSNESDLSKKLKTMTAVERRQHYVKLKKDLNMEDTRKLAIEFYQADMKIFSTLKSSMEKSFVALKNKYMADGKLKTDDEYKKILKMEQPELFAELKQTNENMAYYYLDVAAYNDLEKSK